MEIIIETQKCDMCGNDVDKCSLRKLNPYTDHLGCPNCWEYSNS